MKNLFNKSTLLIALVIALADSTCIAQTPQQGMIIAGGSVGFESTSLENGTSSTTIQLAPGIGIMATNRLGLGAELLYFRESFDDFSETAYGFSPFIRYYIYKGLFPQFQYVWLNSAISGTPFDGSVSENGHEFLLGYTAFLSPSVALEPAIYHRSIFDESSLGLRMGLRIFLGGDE